MTRSLVANYGSPRPITGRPIRGRKLHPEGLRWRNINVQNSQTNISLGIPHHHSLVAVPTNDDQPADRLRPAIEINIVSQIVQQVSPETSSSPAQLYDGSPSTSNSSRTSPTTSSSSSV